MDWIKDNIDESQLVCFWIHDHIFTLDVRKIKAIRKNPHSRIAMIDNKNTPMSSSIGEIVDTRSPIFLNF